MHYRHSIDSQNILLLENFYLICLPRYIDQSSILWFKNLFSIFCYFDIFLFIDHWSHGLVKFLKSSRWGGHCWLVVLSRLRIWEGRPFHRQSAHSLPILLRRLRFCSHILSRCWTPNRLLACLVHHLYNNEHHLPELHYRWSQCKLLKDLR